jgi:hypothetical protein
MVTLFEKTFIYPHRPPQKLEKSCSRAIWDEKNPEIFSHFLGLGNDDSMKIAYGTDIL